MDVDHDLSDGTTPLGTPFEADYTTHQHGGAPSVDPPAGVLTSTFFTPLYTESQETDNTTASTGHLSPQPPNARLARINKAEEEELTATAVAEAEAYRTTKLEAEAAAHAAKAKVLAAAAAATAEAHSTA